MRRKTSQQTLKTYYTFLGEEGRQAILNWLKIREKEFGKIHDGDPIFLVKNKFNGRIVPPQRFSIQAFLVRMQRKLKIKPLIEEKRRTRYGYHIHEMRDFFKSMCTLAGVSNIASEYWLGHDIDKLGYDKSPQYDEKFFEREYLKVEPKLRVWTSATESPEVSQLKTLVQTRLLNLDTANLDQLKGIAQILGIPTTEPDLKSGGLLQISDEMIGFPMDTPFEIERMLRALIYYRLGLKPEGIETSGELKNIAKLDKMVKDAAKTIQKIVDEKDLETYLNDGWLFVSSLNNGSGKCIIRK